MKQSCHFLVVDDDSTSNLICDFVIQRFNREALRDLFTSPEEALDFIRKQKTGAGTVCAVLFLDVNMPTMTGFEFLKEFEKLDPEIKEQYKIYMLTSSIEDFSPRIEEFPMVKGFLSKPLKLSYLERIQLELEDPLSAKSEN